MENKRNHSNIVVNEIIIYQTEEGHTKIDVKFKNETVWLTQAQLCELYQSSKSNISEHIKHIFEEEQLNEESVVRKFRITAADGKNYNGAYDRALLKALYLSTMQATKKWNFPLRNWGKVYGEFSIMYGERFS